MACVSLKVSILSTLVNSSQNQSPELWVENQNPEGIFADVSAPTCCSVWPLAQAQSVSCMASICCGEHRSRNIQNFYVDLVESFFFFFFANCIFSECIFASDFFGVGLQSVFCFVALSGRLGTESGPWPHLRMQDESYHLEETTLFLSLCPSGLVLISGSLGFLSSFLGVGFECKDFRALVGSFVIPRDGPMWLLHPGGSFIESLLVLLMPFSCLTSSGILHSHWSFPPLVESSAGCSVCDTFFLLRCCQHYPPTHYLSHIFNSNPPPPILLYSVLLHWICNSCLLDG